MLDPVVIPNAPINLPPPTRPSCIIPHLENRNDIAEQSRSERRIERRRDELERRSLATRYSIALHEALLEAGCYNVLEERISLIALDTSECREYRVDIWIPGSQVVVEVDGRHHQDERNQQSWDSDRDAYLEGIGISVLRVTNQAIYEDVQSAVDYVLEFCATDRRYL